MGDETSTDPDLPKEDIKKDEEVGPVEYSQPIKLNPKMFPLNDPSLHILKQQGANDSPDIIGLFLTENSDGIRHAGHAVVAISKNEPTVGILNINFCKTVPFRKRLEQSTNIPDDIKDFTTQGNVLDALEMGKDYREKKLGGLFWIAAMKILYQKGLKKIRIKGDVTIGQKDPLSSFYIHHGADVDQEGNMEIDLDRYFSEKKEGIDSIFASED